MPTHRRRRRIPKRAGRTKQTLKCNPAIKDPISPDSCLNAELVDTIKKNVPDQGVLNKCKSDKCLIDSVPNNTIRAYIVKHALAPKQPTEWKNNINTWLSNFDINKVMDQYEDANPDFKFFPSTYIDFDTKLDSTSCVNDDICRFSLAEHLNNGKRKFGFVFNLADHTQSGSHWISAYIDIDDGYAFFFNSTGEKIPTEVRNLVTRIKGQARKLNYNLKLHTNMRYNHQEGNTECGMYSLFFIITMLTNKHDNIEFKSLHEKIEFFKKYKIPDDYVEELRFEYFNS